MFNSYNPFGNYYSGSLSPQGGFANMGSNTYSGWYGSSSLSSGPYDVQNGRYIPKGGGGATGAIGQPGGYFPYMGTANYGPMQSSNPSAPNYLPPNQNPTTVGATGIGSTSSAYGPGLMPAYAQGFGSNASQYTNPIQQTAANWSNSSFAKALAPPAPPTQQTPPSSAPPDLSKFATKSDIQSLMSGLMKPTPQTYGYNQVSAPSFDPKVFQDSTNKTLTTLMGQVTDELTKQFEQRQKQQLQDLTTNIINPMMELLSAPPPATPRQRPGVNTNRALINNIGI